MATVIKTAEFMNFGAAGPFPVPERIDLRCPRCNQEVGRNCTIAFYTVPGPDAATPTETLAIGVNCSKCGFLPERPVVERLF